MLCIFSGVFRFWDAHIIELLHQFFEKWHHCCSTPGVPDTTHIVCGIEFKRKHGSALYFSKRRPQFIFDNLGIAIALTHAHAHWSSESINLLRFWKNEWMKNILLLILYTKSNCADDNERFLCRPLKFKTKATRAKDDYCEELSKRWPV